MNKQKFRLVYGIGLIAVGLSVFYRIPIIIPKLQIIEFFNKNILLPKIALYILGVLLIIAGSIRIFNSLKKR